jgi:antitoxin component YwqK of YwqJK toxin-antitoxin module
MKRLTIIIFIFLLSAQSFSQDTLTSDKIFFKDTFAYRKSDSSIFTGLQIDYYHGNKNEIWQKQYYEKGLKNGHYEIYTQKGDTIEYGEYKLGLKNGKFVYFWDNKKIHHIEYFSKGQLIKPATLYDINGNIIDKQNN